MKIYHSDGGTPRELTPADAAEMNKRDPALGGLRGLFERAVQFTFLDADGRELLTVGGEELRRGMREAGDWPP